MLINSLVAEQPISSPSPSKSEPIPTKGFINKEEEKASLSDAIRHINHIVDLIGIDHVGIGSEFVVCSCFRLLFVWKILYSGHNP